MNKFSIILAVFIGTTVIITACSSTPISVSLPETPTIAAELPTIIPSETSSLMPTKTNTFNDSTESTEEILYVSPFWVPCEDIAPKLCMQVNSTEDGEWQTFYGAIEGFLYEPGNTYQLRVKKESLSNPPADASSQKWILLEEISKSPAELPQLDLTGSSWNLVSLSGNAPVNQSQITLSFSENNVLNGNAGCNTYRGSYQLHGMVFESAALASTKMACPEPIMTQENKFFQVLSAARTQELINNQLLFITPQMEFLLFELIK